MFILMSRRMTKPTKWSVRPAKTQISLGIRPVWSESSLCAQWVAEDPSFLHVNSKDSDQTGRMLRLIRVFTGRTGHFILSWGCSFTTMICTSRIHSISEFIHFAQMTKPTKWHVRPAKTQISPAPGWSESSLGAVILLVVSWGSSNVQSHEKMDLSIVLETCMHIHSIGPKMWLHIVCANSKGSGETAQMCRLAWALAVCLWDRYHFLMSWLKSWPSHTL